MEKNNVEKNEFSLEQQAIADAWEYSRLPEAFSDPSVDINMILVYKIMREDIKNSGQERRMQYMNYFLKALTELKKGRETIN